MKKIIYILAFVAAYSPSFSQKCKEIVDPITNEKRYEYVCTGNFGDHSIYNQFSYEIKKDGITFTKEFLYNGGMKTIMPVGTELFIKLKDGEILKLKTVKETSPKIYGGYSITSGYTYVMGLSKSDLSKLAASEIVLIRIPKVDSDGYIDLEKKDFHIKKTEGKMKEGAACMSAYL